MAMKMFQKNPEGLASVSDRIRGCIAIVCTIGSFTCANYAENNQWLAFFMIFGFLSMITALGIVFKEV